MGHRDWIVLRSIESDEHRLCVDFFEDLERNYGFEQFRSDPEDMGRWTSLSMHSASRWSDLITVYNRAATAVVWLSSEPRARAALESLISEVMTGRRAEGG